MLSVCPDLAAHVSQREVELVALRRVAPRTAAQILPATRTIPATNLSTSAWKWAGARPSGRFTVLSSKTIGISRSHPGLQRRNGVNAALRHLREVNRVRAFTLIELILVMAMLAIVISVALPSLKRFFRGRNLDSEARRFLSLTRYGQSRAVSEGVPMVLWIDPQQSTYGLRAQSGYAEADTNTVQFALDKDLKVEAVTPQLTSLTQSNLWTQSAPPVGTLPMIRFQPDGFISETSPDQIVFRQGADDRIGIAQSTNRLKYEIQTIGSPVVRR